jgi:HlyD family secretion protein
MQLDQTSFAADVAKNQAAVNAQKIEIEFLSAQHHELRRQFAVKEKLYAQKLVGFDDLEQFKSQMLVSTIKIKAAKERLNQHLATLTFAQDRLSKTTFRATMPGLIAAVDVKPGETVIAGTTNIIGSALMTLADPTTILAELRVDEADIASVKPGMTVEVFAAANPKQALNGDVISIGTSARSSRQGLGLYFRVKALIKDNQQLYPGMSCRAEIITAQSENSLNVPISSIRKEQDKYYVWMMVNNKASKHYVEVGMATDTQQQLISGVTKGQTVVTGPSRVMQDIKEGSALREKQGS